MNVIHFYVLVIFIMTAPDLSKTWRTSLAGLYALFAIISIAPEMLK